MKYWVFMAVIDLIIPVIMIAYGLLFQYKLPKKSNIIYGYKTPMSSRNNDTWKFAHSHCGRLLCKFGLLGIIPTVIILLLIMKSSRNIVSAVGIIVFILQFIPLISVVPLTEKALKSTFDDQGDRYIDEAENHEE